MMIEASMKRQYRKRKAEEKKQVQQDEVMGEQMAVTPEHQDADASARQVLAAAKSDLDRSKKVIKNDDGAAIQLVGKGNVIEHAVMKGLKEHKRKKGHEPDLSKVKTEPVTDDEQEHAHGESVKKSVEGSSEQPQPDEIISLLSADNSPVAKVRDDDQASVRSTESRDDKEDQKRLKITTDPSGRTTVEYTRLSGMDFPVKDIRNIVSGIRQGLPELQNPTISIGFHKDEVHNNPNLPGVDSSFTSHEESFVEGDKDKKPVRGIAKRKATVKPEEPQSCDTYDDEDEDEDYDDKQQDEDWSEYQPKKKKAMNKLRKGASAGSVKKKTTPARNAKDKAVKAGQ